MSFIVYFLSPELKKCTRAHINSRHILIDQGRRQNFDSGGGGPSGSQGGQANCKNISMYIV